MDSRKRFPFLLMLVAGAITGIFAYIRDFSLLDTILWLACAMFVFFTLGYLIRSILDGFEKDIREKEKAAAMEAARLAALEESAVIEKDMVEGDDRAKDPGSEAVRESDSEKS